MLRQINSKRNHMAYNILCLHVIYFMFTYFLFDSFHHCTFYPTELHCTQLFLSVQQVCCQSLTRSFLHSRYKVSMALDKRKQRKAIASNQITLTARQPLSDIIWKDEADVNCSTLSESGQPFWITLDFWCTFRRHLEKDFGFGLKPRGTEHN